MVMSVWECVREGAMTRAAKARAWSRDQSESEASVSGGGADVQKYFASSPTSRSRMLFGTGKP
jgi:hypothetical protein